MLTGFAVAAVVAFGDGDDALGVTAVPPQLASSSATARTLLLVGRRRATRRTLADGPALRQGPPRRAVRVSGAFPL
jgi:hypothetical protein